MTATKGTQKDSLAGNILRYTSSNVFQHVLGLGTAFIRPRLLAPSLYGVYNLLSVIPTYFSYGNLGSFDISRYRIPYHEARGEHEESLTIQASVYYGTLIINLVLTCAMVVVALSGAFTPVIRSGLLIMSLVVVVQWYHDNYVLMLKARENFARLSASIYVKAISSLAATALLTWRFGLYGALAASVLALVPVLLYLRVTVPIGKQPRFNGRVFLRLIRDGFPIMVYNFTVVLLNTSDRLVITYFLGYEQLGYYGVAIMAYSFLRQIPGRAREVLEPRLMRSVSGQSREEILREYLFKPLLTTAFLMPLLIGPAVLLLPAVIPLLLPKYAPGILATQIIVVGCYFLALSYVTRGIIVAYGWQVGGAVMMAAALLCNVALSIGLIKAGLGIAGVAAAAGLSQLVLLVGSLAYLRVKCGCAAAQWGSTLFGICLPLLATAAGIGILQMLLPVAALGPLVGVPLQVALFTVFILGTIALAKRKFPLLQGISVHSL